MTPITSLPAELLITIFNHLEEITDAAECRLVCRAWNDPAERAMFEHGITISSALNDEAKMQSLFNVLIKDQQKRRHWIKHLKLYIHTTAADTPNNIHELILLAMNQNINTISGLVYDLVVVDRITNIISNSDEGIDQIRELRLRYQADFSFPRNLELACKNTLETLEVVDFRGISSPLIPRLNEFTRLTSLILVQQVTSFSTLEEILDKCQHLQKLELTTNEQENSSNGGSEWNQQDIILHPNIKTLKTTHIRKCPANMLGYMVHKLVNLNSISITLFTKMDSSHSGFRRIPAIIKKVPKKEIFCSDQQDARGIMQLMNDYENITMEKTKWPKVCHTFYKITF